LLGLFGLAIAFKSADGPSVYHSFALLASKLHLDLILHISFIVASVA